MERIELANCLGAGATATLTAASSAPPKSDRGVRFSASDTDDPFKPKVQQTSDNARCVFGLSAIN